MPDLEPFALYFMAAGATVVLIGLIWLLVVAFKTGFIRQAFVPVLVVLLGVVVALSVPLANKLFPKPIDTGAKEEQKTNPQGTVEDRLTLKGAKREDYAKLKGGTKYAVIQWANPDVTDEDAAVLADQTELREVDLNDTQVTDVTLDRLLKLPKLTRVYAARTKISGETVKKLIFDNPDCKVNEIDFRGLTPPVPGAAQREWKNADKARKAN